MRRRRRSSRCVKIATKYCVTTSPVSVFGCPNSPLPEFDKSSKQVLGAVAALNQCGRVITPSWAEGSAEPLSLDWRARVRHVLQRSSCGAELNGTIETSPYWQTIPKNHA